MNADALAYAVDTRPGEMEAMPIAPGILWVRLMIPIKGLDFVNVWLLEDGDGWTVIDTGLKSKKTIGWWQGIIDRHLAGKPVRRVICTHFHPDHMGLAGWLSERFDGAPLWMTFSEWSFGRMLWLDSSEEVPEDVVDFYRRIGWSEQQLDRVKESGHNRFSLAVADVPRGIRRISDGEEIEIGGKTWQILVGEGHSPEHACFYCAELNILISGDQVLPRITPHIGVYPGEPDADPLTRFIESLELFRHLPRDVLVLPSHGDPFFGLHPRLDALRDHHVERLERLYAACQRSVTAAQIIPAMFTRELRPEDINLATAEGLAHLHCLVRSERLTRQIGPDGVYRYQRQP